MTSQRRGRGLVGSLGVTPDGRRVWPLQYSRVRQSVTAWEQAVGSVVEHLRGGREAIALDAAQVARDNEYFTTLLSDTRDVAADLATMLLARRHCTVQSFEALNFAASHRGPYLLLVQRVNLVPSALSFEVTSLGHDNGLLPPMALHRLTDAFFSHTLSSASELLAQKTRDMLSKCQRYIIYGTQGGTASSGGSSRAEVLEVALSAPLVGPLVAPPVQMHASQSLATPGVSARGDTRTRSPGA